MEKASESTANVSSKIVKQPEIGKYLVTFCHLPLKFHIMAERLLFFDSFG